MATISDQAALGAANTPVSVAALLLSIGWEYHMALSLLEVWNDPADGGGLVYGAGDMAAETDGRKILPDVGHPFPCPASPGGHIDANKIYLLSATLNKKLHITASVR